METTNTTSPYLDLSESQWQEVVVARARARGWLVHHDRRQDLGIGGDAGFPDLVLALRGVVLFVELKSETGRLTDAQTSWLYHLGGQWLDGARSWAVVWRPRDWHVVARVLDRGPVRPLEDLAADLVQLAYLSEEDHDQ